MKMKFEGHDVDVKLPKADIDINAPDLNLKGPEVDFESPGGKIKGPKVNLSSISGPKGSMPDVDLKGPKIKGDFDMSVPKIEGDKTVSEIDIKGPQIDAPAIEIKVKGKKGKFKLPKVKGKAKKTDVDVETSGAGVNVDTSNINVKGTKKSLFGKLHFPDVELDIKSPKMKGDVSLSEGLKTDLDSACASNVTFEGLDINTSSDIPYPEGKVTFPQIKAPKFAIALPQMEGVEAAGNSESAPASGGSLGIHSPSLSYQASAHNIEISTPEVKQSESKVKVKIPRFFVKSKAKNNSSSDLKGPEVGMISSQKGESDDVSGLMGAVSVSPKGKSASLDLFKKSKYHTSLSTEGELAFSSDSAHLDAEGGDISLNLGEGKSKEKKGKLKFGTFGGFGSRSKGSYEVTLGEDRDTSVEGTAGLSLSSKKSRLSSSSSSESGSKGGLKLPKVELSVSPKTD